MMTARLAKRCLSIAICLIAGLALSWTSLGTVSQARAAAHPESRPAVARVAPAPRAVEAGMLSLVGVAVAGIGIAEVARTRLRA